MKNFLPVLLLLSFNILTFGVKAQNQPFSSFETIDVGNIKSRVLVHGDMWSDPATTMQQCEFPKASGKHIAGTASIWMGGYDAQNNYCMAAQQYRSAGVDYWPGPLGVSDAGVSYAVSKDWARIWKIRRWELSMFLNTTVHTLQNTPASILEWPAKGNPHARGFNNAVNTCFPDVTAYLCLCFRPIGQRMPKNIRKLIEGCLKKAIRIKSSVHFPNCMKLLLVKSIAWNVPIVVKITLPVSNSRI